MIYLALVRMAVCEICGGDWILSEGEVLPPQCCVCGSTLWLYGVEPQDQVRVRTGLTFAPRRSDGRVDRRKSPGAGAKSLKRRERARKQYRALKPKPVDDQAGT